MPERDCQWPALAVLSRENLEIASPLKAHLGHVDVVIVVFDVEHFDHSAPCIPALVIRRRGTRGGSPNGRYEHGHGLGWKRGMHLHAERLSTDTRDGGDVTQEVVIEPFKKGRVDCIPHGGQEQRMAIGWREHNGFGGDIAAGPQCGSR